MYPQIRKTHPSEAEKSWNPINRSARKAYCSRHPLEDNPSFASFAYPGATTQAIDNACDRFEHEVTNYWRILLSELLADSKEKYSDASFNSLTRPLHPIEIEFYKKAAIAGMDMPSLFALPANDGPIGKNWSASNPEPISTRYEAAIAALIQFCLLKITSTTNEYIRRYWLGFAFAEGVEDIADTPDFEHPLFAFGAPTGIPAFILSDPKRPSTSGLIRFAYGESAIHSPFDKIGCAYGFYAPKASKAIPRKGLALTDEQNEKIKYTLFAQGDNAIITNRESLEMPLTKDNLPAIFPAPHRLASFARALESLYSLAGMRCSYDITELSATLAIATTRLYNRQNKVFHRRSIELEDGFTWIVERVHALVFERAIALNTKDPAALIRKIEYQVK